MRVTPSAATNRVQGLMSTDSDTTILKIAVTAAPENGKANAAVIKLLAKLWRIPESAIAVHRGETDRRKVLHLRGDTATLMSDLISWLETQK